MHPYKLFYSQDDKVQFTVLNDRSQGGSSLNDGQVELMVRALHIHMYTCTHTFSHRYTHTVTYTHVHTLSSVPTVSTVNHPSCFEKQCPP